MNPSLLKLQWLLYFMDVAETKNFTRTAENHFTSQSNISYAIRSLEKTLGVPLFIRRENEIILSKYGEVFLPYVKNAFSELGEGCGKLKEMVDPVSGDVRIGFSFVYAMDMIPDLYRVLYDDFAVNNLNIRLRSALAHVNEDLSCVEDLVLSGQCDIGLTCGRMREGCTLTKVGAVEHVLLVPKEHPLAEEKSVTLQQVRDEPFILLDGDSGLLNYYGRMFEYFGITPKIVGPGVSWMTILLQVSAGTCLSIAPKARYSDYEVVGIPLDHPMTKRDFYIATPNNRKLSSAANYTKKLLIEYFKDYFDE